MNANADKLILEYRNSTSNFIALVTASQKRLEGVLEHL